MREIKFRAWDSKKMVYLAPLEVENQNMGLILSGNIDGKPEAVMQYTGLQDKTSRNIFEGDIVAGEETVMSDQGEDKPGYIEKRIVSNFEYAGGQIGERRYGRKLYEVCWKNSSCGFEPFSDSEENCGHCGGGMSSSRMEVIGNIYENPELLDK